MQQQIKYQCSKCQGFNVIDVKIQDEWKPEDNPNNWIQNGFPTKYIKKCDDCGHEKHNGRGFSLTDPNYKPDVKPDPIIIEF